MFSAETFWIFVILRLVSALYQSKALLQGVYGLVHQNIVVRDRMLFIFWSLPVVIVYTRQNMAEGPIFVLLFRRMFHISRKIFLAGLFFTTFSIYCFNEFGGAPRKHSAIFCRKKISANVVSISAVKVWL